MSKSTKNYEWFKFLANNRPISQRHLNNLRKQFQNYGNITEVSPITVNNHGFILDGQHRRLLCEEFGYPVHYNEITPKNIELTPAINSNQKRWGAMDFVNFFAEVRPEYEALSNFMRVNEITYTIANAVIFPQKGSSAMTEELEAGRLEVIELLPEAQKRMDLIHEINELMGSPMTERYVRGILRCLYMEHFEIERFLYKLRIMAKNNNGTPNPRATNKTDVMRNIENIYNFHTTPEKTVLLFR